MLLMEPTLQKRSALSILDQLKSAYSSPSNCIHSNWCRIPMAVVIFVFLVILFTCFCCWAQCIACCCCSGSKSKRRSGDFNQGANLLNGSSGYSHRPGGLPNMPEYPMNDLKAPKFAVIGDDGSVTTDSPKPVTASTSVRNTVQSHEQPLLPQVEEKETEASGWASAETYRAHEDARLPRFAERPLAPQQHYNRPLPNQQTMAPQPVTASQTMGSNPWERQQRFARPPPPPATGYDNRQPRPLPELARQQPRFANTEHADAFAAPSRFNNTRQWASTAPPAQQRMPIDRASPFDQRPPPLVAPQPRAPMPDWRQQGDHFAQPAPRSLSPAFTVQTSLPPYPASSPARSMNDSRDDVNDIYGAYGDPPASQGRAH